MRMPEIAMNDLIKFERAKFNQSVMQPDQSISAISEVSRGYAHLDYAKASSQPHNRCQELRNVLDCWNRAIDIGLETVPSIMKTVEADLYFAIGLELYRKEGKASQAVSDFSRVLHIEPGHVKAHIERGKVWLDMSVQSGQTRKSALDDFTKAIELGCNKIEVFEMRGKCYDQIGQFRLATADFSKAIELEPDRHFNYYHRANSLRKGKQYLAAREDYRKVLAFSSNQKLIDLAVTRLQDIENLVDQSSSVAITDTHTNQTQNESGILTWLGITKKSRNT